MYTGGWATHDVIREHNRIFDTVRIGDVVAINEMDEDFWWQGKVLAIKKERGLREVRFQEYTIIRVECFEPQRITRSFVSYTTREILFKDE